MENFNFKRRSRRTRGRKKVKRRRKNENYDLKAFFKINKKDELILQIFIPLII